MKIENKIFEIIEWFSLCSNPLEENWKQTAKRNVSQLTKYSLKKKNFQKHE